MFKNINPNFAIILSTLLWGTWWFPLRLLNESANNNAIPLTLSFLIAGLFLLCFSFKNIHLLSKRNIMLTLVAATMGAAAMCLYNEGLLRGNVARILIFFYLTAVWSTIIEIVFLKVPLTVSRALSITAGFIGLFIITGLDKGNFLPNSLADIFGILSGLLWSICASLIRVNEELDVNFGTSIFILMGGVFVLIATLLPDGQIISGFNSQILFQTYLIILAFAFIWLLPGYWLITYGQDQVDPGRAGILLMFEVVIGIISAYLIANELISIRELLGALFILSAPLVELYSSRKVN
ncbi:DMT family transporter [Pelagibacteraceae bacterium]|nr:DMT family transporter [Pelagibacteraceae bacterium]